MSTQLIPLAALSLSPRNTRRTGGKNVADLAASIAAHGLLQNLTVERLPASEAGLRQAYGVIAGGRRLAALQLLASEGRLPAELAAGIPCRVEADETRIIEISTAENTVRQSMHPHDEFVAFRDLANQGLGVDTIAARFGVTPLVVERRLKLANVSPVLLRLFREDGLTLEQMMAFAITDDHAAQERVWKAAQFDHQREPRSIRAALTQGEISSTDRRVVFVGLDAYEAAGGGVHRDLFRAEHYVSDAALLEQLVDQKLAEVERELTAEGWSFVKTARERPGELLDGTERSQIQLHGEVKAKAEELEAAVDAAAEALGAFEDAMQSGSETLDDDEYNKRFMALEDAHDRANDALFAHLAANQVYFDRQKAKSGAVAWISHRGELQIERGIIPKGARAELAAAASRTTGDTSTSESAPPPAADPSRALIRRLSMHRTIGLQCALMGNANVSLALLCNALLQPLVLEIGEHSWHQTNALDITARHARQRVRASGCADVDASPHAVKLDTDVQEMLKHLRVPTKREVLLPWLLNQGRDTLVALLALVPVLTLDAVSESTETPAANLAAEALDLDMADYWQPTAEAWASIVPRPLTIEALREVHGDAIAAKAEAMKKAELIPFATEQLQGRGWLPKPLRRPGYTLRGREAEATADQADTAKPKPKPAAPKKATKPAGKKPATKKPAAKAKPKAKAKPAKKPARKAA